MSFRSAFAYRSLHTSVLLVALALPALIEGQTAATERAFPQSKAQIEAVLKTVQGNLSGHLPTLDGFAAAAHPLDQYQRGFFQTTVEIAPIPSGGSLVRVTAKVTAWYSDPAGGHSGYQLLRSNGRLEADLLDELADQLAANSRANPAANNAKHAGAVPQSPQAQETTSTQANQEPLISAPSAKFPDPGTFSSSLSQGLASQERAATSTPAKTSLQETDSALQSEANALEQVLKSQGHPDNLVAVKKSGTPVVTGPSLSAKTLFLASMHDEFEMLDFNQDWVHVRISGLSRGWIWRDSVEMPNGIPDTASHAAAPSAADLFHVVREESAPFPGDWPPLRGKTVRIISVQKVDESEKGGGPQDKLEYSKFLLDKSYSDSVQKKENIDGIVLVFDSVDGGMLAATASTLQQWKTGTISDAAFWHNCFFDPPETFSASASGGAQ